MMKKISLVLPVVISLAVALPVGAKAHASEQNVTNSVYATNEVSMTNIEIQNKLNEISNKYKVGEYLSDEDANFVRMYASQPTNVKDNTITPMLAKTITGNKSYGNVALSGSVTVDVGVINNSINGNVVTKDNKKLYHSDLGSVIELRCFGVFGEGGSKIGLVYSQDYKKTTPNSNYNKQNVSDNFVASVAYYTVDVRGIVDGNTF